MSRISRTATAPSFMLRVVAAAAAAATFALLIDGTEASSLSGGDGASQSESSKFSKKVNERERERERKVGEIIYEEGGRKKSVVEGEDFTRGGWVGSDLSRRES
jgi:hypothetical protein